MFSVIFPGQGSQLVGMGKDFFEKFELVKELFKEADDTLGVSLSKIILEGPKEELDITDEASIEYVFNNYEFDYLFHSAALSRPMIQHEESPNLSINVNIIGTSNLVMYCNTYGKKIIYVSTDYVYSGTDNQHTENSSVRPTNKYSWSKLGGECAVQLCNKYLILRLGMVEYPFPHSHAFTNVYKSSIWSDEVPNVVNPLFEKEGIYNVGA